jgi:four helix bundle protein
VRRAHHELIAWRSSIALVKTIYDLTAKFSREETFGVTAQMRRSAISVPSNIAEGAARSSKKEFVHFLVIARGSLSELETQLEIAKQLGYFNEVSEELQTEQHVDQIFALLGGLIRSNQAKLRAHHT